jgi:hypothetical protein
VANDNLAVRWTIGDVSEHGFEALRLSIWGAFRLFGSGAAYTVCVNSVPLDVARARTGGVPDEVAWRHCDREVPGFVRARFDSRMAEGVGWKLAPLQLSPERYELALDNDCILWETPAGLVRWLADDGPSTLIAADVRCCFGVFAELCGPEPRNSGIRGLPPGFNLEGALRGMLDRVPGVLRSELDEQGLQVAALAHAGPVHVVEVEEVSICSPFPPHLPTLGRCGAHFVGLNAKRLGFSLDGRSAEEHVRENFARLRADLYRNVGLPAPSGDALTV